MNKNMPDTVKAIEQRGFSLLEVLLVLTIIGITSGAALAFFPSGDSQSLRREAQRLAQLFPLAQAEARKTGQTVIWENDAQGYRFIRLPRELLLPPEISLYAANDAAAFAMDDALRPRHWPDGSSIRVKVVPANARRFDGEWLAAPMQVELEQTGQRVVIKRDGDGSYQVAQ